MTTSSTITDVALLRTGPHRRRFAVLSGVSILAMVLLMPAPSFGDTWQWNFPGTSPADKHMWQNGDNWLPAFPGGPPADADTVFARKAGSFSSVIVYGHSETGDGPVARSLTVSDGLNLSLVVNPVGYENINLTLTAAPSSPAAIDPSNAGLVVGLKGPGGFADRDILDISDVETVHAFSALVGVDKTGLLVVDGNLELLDQPGLPSIMQLGHAAGGDGRVSVVEGGQLTTGLAVLGYDKAASGSVWVGESSAWTAGNVTVGAAGTGSVSIGELGYWKSGRVTVGETGTGSVSVNNGSRWDSGPVTIGEAGTGSVAISDNSIWNAGAVTIGGSSSGSATVGYSTVKTGDVVLGDKSPASGTMLVHAFSSWTAALLTVGNAGSGDVHIYDSSTLTTGPAVLGVEVGSNGTVRVDALSGWQAENVTVGKAGAGQVTIMDSSAWTTGDATLGETTTGSGSVVVSDGATWNAGTVIIGKVGKGIAEAAYYANVTTGNVVLGEQKGADGTMNVHAMATWKTPSLTVGDSGTGTLNIYDGAQVTSDLSVIGIWYAGDNAAYVGPGATWNAGDLQVGSSGKGDLVIDAGTVEAPLGTAIGYWHGQGHVTVTNGGIWNSAFADIGQRGRGFVTISNGAAAHTGNVSVGSVLAGEGHVDIYAHGTWTAGDVGVGFRCIGDITLYDGGQLITSSIELGSYNGRASLSLDGTDTRVVAGNLLVGDINGLGTVTVQNGATLVTDNGGLGLGSNVLNGGDGYVNVINAGSSWTTNQLNVGMTLGSGTVTVRDGAKLQSMTGKIGADSDARGAVVVDNAVWTNTQDVKLGASYDVNYERAGLLKVANGGLVDIGTTLYVDDTGKISLNGEFGPGASTVKAATIENHGIIEGTGTLIGDITNFGVISPGHSIGALLVEGNLSSLGESGLIIEIAGGSAFDTIDATGTGLLEGGQIEFDFTDGFLPKAGNSFQFFSADALTLSDMWYILEGATGEFEVTWSANSLTFTALSDFEGVPEPASIALMGFGAAMVFAGRRRRKAQKPSRTTCN